MSEQEKSESSYSIRGYYVKSLQFKVKALSLSEEDAKSGIQYAQEMEMQTSEKAEGHYEVTLSISVTGKVKEHTLFTAELEQSGLFQVKGIEGDALKRLLAIQAPHMIYPYASRVLSQITQDGGLSPLNLPPIDFAAMYQQRLNKAKSQQQNSSKAVAAEVLPAKKAPESSEDKSSVYRAQEIHTQH